MKNCLEVLGDRRCCIARELTKMHEEFLRGTIRELLPELAGLKGEMVVVIEGNRDDYSSDVDYGEILTMVNEAVAAGMTTSAAIRQIASETGVSKNKIYELVHQQEN